MTKLLKEIITNQIQASLAMLESCVRQCPEENWHAPVVNLTFNQTVFHALFFTDVYLGPNLKSLYEQPFHQEHAAIFGDYEELEDREQQNTYEKEFIFDYIRHCRDKVATVIAAETAEDLQRRPGFDWQTFSRAELHVYNLRHLHHHVAALALLLRLNSGVETPWVRSGGPE